MEKTVQIHYFGRYLKNKLNHFLTRRLDVQISSDNFR